MKQSQLRKELQIDTQAGRPYPTPYQISLLYAKPPGLHCAFEKTAPAAGSTNSTGPTLSRNPGETAGIFGESSPTIKVFSKGSKTPEKEDAFGEAILSCHP